MFSARFCRYKTKDDDYTIVQGRKKFETAVEMIQYIDNIHLWTDNPIKLYKNGKIFFDDFYYMLRQPYPAELGLPSTWKPLSQRD